MPIELIAHSRAGHTPKTLLHDADATINPAPLYLVCPLPAYNGSTLPAVAEERNNTRARGASYLFRSAN